MELILKALISIIFGLAIFGKLTGKTKSTFEKAGYSSLFMISLAFAELISVIALFTKHEFYAIVALISILLGAIFTLFRQKAKPQQYGLALLAIGLLIALYLLKNHKKFISI